MGRRTYHYYSRQPFLQPHVPFMLSILPIIPVLCRCSACPIIPIIMPAYCAPPYLGAAIGSKEYREDYVATKVKTWIEEIHVLTDIASTQPHAVYSALLHGVASRWSFVSRTIPDVQSLFEPLEDAIHQLLIPALTGRPPCSKTKRDIIALPARFGGLGILNASANSHLSTPRLP